MFAQFTIKPTDLYGLLGATLPHAATGNDTVPALCGIALRISPPLTPGRAVLTATATDRYSVAITTTDIDLTAGTEAGQVLLDGSFVKAFLPALKRAIKANTPLEVAIGDQTLIIDGDARYVIQHVAGEFPRVGAIIGKAIADRKAVADGPAWDGNGAALATGFNPAFLARINASATALSVADGRRRNLDPVKFYPGLEARKVILATLGERCIIALMPSTPYGATPEALMADLVGWADYDDQENAS